MPRRTAGVFGDLRGDVVGVSLRGVQSRADGATRYKATMTVSPPDLDDVCELDGLRTERVE